MVSTSRPPLVARLCCFSCVWRSATDIASIASGVDDCCTRFAVAWAVASCVASQSASHSHHQYGWASPAAICGARRPVGLPSGANPRMRSWRAAWAWARYFRCSISRSAAVRTLNLAAVSCSTLHCLLTPTQPRLARSPRAVLSGVHRTRSKSGTVTSTSAVPTTISVQTAMNTMCGFAGKSPFAPIDACTQDTQC